MIQPQISEAEYEVMKVIWDNEPVSTNEIVDIVTKTHKWNMRTVHTLISRLDKKGAICHKKEGRIFVYSSLIKKDEYIKTESKSFIKKFYDGTANKMVMNFIKNDMLSEEDIEELRNILNKKG